MLADQLAPEHPVVGVEHDQLAWTPVGGISICQSPGVVERLAGDPLTFVGRGDLPGAAPALGPRPKASLDPHTSVDRSSYVADCGIAALAQRALVSTLGSHLINTEVKGESHVQGHYLRH